MSAHRLILVTGAAFAAVSLIITFWPPSQIRASVVAVVSAVAGACLGLLWCKTGG